VLEITGRPAVLQERVNGLPSSDWPALVSVPGVCFRLLLQAAQALESIHAAGLVHGHLHENLVLLTPDGVVKICGLGEPAWLAEDEAVQTTDPASDLRNLGNIALKWCTPLGIRRGAKTKPPPDALVALVTRLASTGKDGIAGALLLLTELDRIRNDIPANPEAWERLLRHVREHALPAAQLRQTA
jgi:hypothetical protein